MRADIDFTMILAKSRAQGLTFQRYTRTYVALAESMTRGTSVHSYHCDAMLVEHDGLNVDDWLAAWQSCRGLGNRLETVRPVMPAPGPNRCRADFDDHADAVRFHLISWRRFGPLGGLSTSVEREYGIRGDRPA